MPKEVVIDTEMILDMAEMDLTQKEMADEIGCSIPTIANRIAKIQQDQGILMKYRDIQSLHLTKIQAKILEAITPDKITQAPLRDLVFAFKILKDKELVVDGKPNEIHGLVGYLVKMEKEELALDAAEDVIDVVGEEVIKEVTDEDYRPNL